MSQSLPHYVSFAQKTSLSIKAYSLNMMWLCLLALFWMSLCHPAQLWVLLHLPTLLSMLLHLLALLVCFALFCLLACLMMSCRHLALLWTSLIPPAGHHSCLWPHKGCLSLSGLTEDTAPLGLVAQEPLLRTYSNVLWYMCLRVLPCIHLVVHVNGIPFTPLFVLASSSQVNYLHMHPTSLPIPDT